MADSYAMDAASSMHSCVYRSGYDVSLPLGPEGYFHSLAKISPLDRNFFLTTKVGAGYCYEYQSAAIVSQHHNFFYLSDLNLFNFQIDILPQPRTVPSLNENKILLPAMQHTRHREPSILPDMGLKSG